MKDGVLPTNDDYYEEELNTGSGMMKGKIKVGYLRRVKDRG